MLPDNEEGEIIRKFNLEDKLETEKFGPCFVKEMQGYDLTLAYVQKHGFSSPILVKEKLGLGLRVPSHDFTVGHVKMCVGSRRLVDVVDVSSQENMEMTMKEWCRYYNDPDKDRLLNVISLEFSHTKLEDYVKSPTIVRQVDWVDCVWPPHLKESQVEPTNALSDMMYPKVQKYCLMSVKGCYTDFHIDFGGSSVWYHILHGSKIFWLIPPTEQNLRLFERWILSGKQADIFFGDTVEKCGRISLHEGNTFFIPSGWIHAVYTPEDALVFGGNFLHSFAIERQLQVAKVETVTHVPRKFRYPYFVEMLWYVLVKYVFVLLGRNHLESKPTSPPQTTNHIHLTPQELHGLKAIVMYLHELPPCRKNVPELLKDPIALIKDVRTVVELHRRDNPELAVTGRCILSGVDDYDVRPRDRQMPKKENSLGSGYGHPPGGDGPEMNKFSTRSLVHRGQGGPRRRRTRCKKCEACQRSDCGECTFCLDMIKFGGTGRAKQTCVTRQCLQPMLPVTAACSACGLDGWGQQPMIPIQKAPRDTPSSLMECSVCYDIAHPDCYAKSCPGVNGVLNEDMPNSWECPRCCKDGKNRAYRPRHFRARQKSSEARQMSFTGAVDVKSEDEVDTESDGSSRGGSPSIDTKRIKIESKTEGPSAAFGRPMDNGASKRSPSDPRKSSSKTQSSMIWSGNKLLKRPTYVVRPAVDHRQPVAAHDGNPALGRAVMVPIFRFLKPQELMQCALVCRAWARFSLDPSLWRRMDFSHKRLTAAHLAGIARRQPEVLILDWSHIAKKQLGWLIGRLPQLRGLSAQGLSASTISALCTCVCPPLHSLDLSFVGSLNDSSLRSILSPPSDSRPGLTDTKSRLGHLRCLKLAGCDISDVSLRYITQHLPRLTVLDLSSCARITDAGVAQLATPSAPTLRNLATLNLANLRGLTGVSLDHLSRCEALTQLNLTHTPLISNEAVDRFKSKCGQEVEIIRKD